MAERKVQSGYVPGRALSPEQYSGGFVDFYKDYLGSTGINVGDDDDDKDDKDDTGYKAPQIIDTGGGDDNTNLLSTVFSNNNLSGGQSYLDSNVEAVDLQSMDLSHKSWSDYKKGAGLADKSSFNKDLAITTGGLAFAGAAGAMVGGAILGGPTATPWGSDNLGAGAFSVIGDKVAAMKYEASMEVKAAKGAFGMTEGAIGDPSNISADTGAAIKINGQYLVRRPNSMQFIGTLPQGVSNQQVHNLIALKEGKLPNYQGGAGTESGFGITGLGGYNADGRFVDANGQISQYGPAKARDALADQMFNGVIADADKYLAELRNRGTFASGVRTYAQALEMGKYIAGTSSSPIATDLRKEQPFGRGNTYTQTPQLDGVFTGRGSLAYDTELDGVYTGPGSLSYDVPQIDGVYTGRYMDDSAYISGPSVKSSPTSPVDRTYFGNAGVDLAAGGPKGIEFSRSRLGGINQGADRFTTAIQGQRAGKSLFADTRTQTPTSLFNDMINRGFTGKQAADVLNTIVPDVKPAISNLPSVTPASYTPPTSDDNNNDSSPSQEQVQAEADMGLDPFGGAGEPVDTSGGGDGGGGGGGDKIVCTAMNNAYGFGSFRQTIWLKHSHSLDPAYQMGYHKLFKPLVKYAYANDNLANRIIKKWLEGVAKRRTADIWLQSRNKKRPIFGRIERAILEPICYIAGKI